MADPDLTPYEQRVNHDDGPVVVSPGDATTTDEAMNVLRGRGVEAWREWCNEHATTAEGA